MPTIRPYQQQVSPEAGLPGRNAQASDFGHTGYTQLGASVQSAAQDAAQATAIIERNRGMKEATDADLNTTLASVTLTEQLQASEKAWKPGDPPLITTAAASMQQALDGLKYNEDGSETYETEHGRSIFAQRAAHLTAQYLQEAGRAQSRLDGVAAEESFKTWTSAKGNFLATGVNYLHIESSLRELDQTLHTGIYTNISEGARAGLFRMGKGFLAENAMEGMIRDNPKGAITALQGGFMADALGEGKTSSLLEKARVMDQLNTQHAKTAQDEFKNAQKDAARSQLSEAVQTYLLHRADPTKPGITPAYLNSLSNLMEFDPQAALSMQGLVDRDMKEAKEGATKGDDAMHRRFLGLIVDQKLPSLAPVNKARVDGLLSREMHDDLVKKYEEARTPKGLTLIKKQRDFFDAMEPVISPRNSLGGFVDNTTGPMMYQFKHDVQQAIDRAREDKRDPYALITPGNPEYMGTPERLKPYTKTMMEHVQAAITQQGLNDAIPAPTPGAAAPAPGATAPAPTAPAPAKPRQSLSEIYRNLVK